MRERARTRFVAGIAAAVLTASTAACGSAPSAGSTAADIAPSASPASVTNCGRAVTVDTAPERIVSTSQPGTEMLLALGLGDRIAGTAFTYGDPPQEYAEQFAKIPTLDAQGAPKREVMLAARPDFVVAGYLADDTNPEDGFASLEELEQAGAPVFGLTVNCTDDPAGTSIETTYEDLLALGALLGAQDRAEQVVASMRAQVADVAARVEGRPAPSVLIYSNGEGPLGVAGSGLSADLVRLAGGRNVFADLPTTFERVSVEAAIEKQPEVFLTVDYTPGSTPQEKADTLYKLLPSAPATTQRRSFPVADVGLGTSVQNGETVEAIARALFPDAF